ncbi:MAG: hypothetical protein A4E55_00480 [Pelotomaculum sp. PtaU1.Bin035]|nr:MAG: hypothetical protein A4E55_00480 [Pelotomaculum sp. PtaU1.Bin035]
MEFFSKFSHSSSKGHCRHGNHGSDYYKRRDRSHSGIIGKIIDTITGSKGHPHSHHHKRRQSHCSS